jgi:F420 biosynthesis protein FbiB-like protein
VSQKIVRKLIGLACRAPSAHNSQPWRFVILESKEIKNKLAREMGKAFKKDLQKDHFAPEIIHARIQESIERIAGAPLLILVCSSKEGRPIFPDKRRNGLEEHMAHQSLGAAIQNFLLAVHAAGLGACWISAPLFCARTVKKNLNLDINWDPAALVVLGYPKGKPKAPSRHSVKKVTLRVK